MSMFNWDLYKWELLLNSSIREHVLESSMFLGSLATKAPVQAITVQLLQFLPWLILRVAVSFVKDLQSLFYPIFMGLYFSDCSVIVMESQLFSDFSFYNASRFV